MVGRRVKEKYRYEECRLKRVEENKKRMEQLNLTSLSLALRTTTPSKPFPMKRVKPRLPRQPLDLSSVRRSNRVANNPLPSYKEVPVEPMGRPRSYGSNRKDLSNRVYASDEDREYARERAEQVESSLPPDLPSFVKPMLQSHVTGGFWLGLPVPFCKAHLPKHDETMTLVDEDSNEWPTRYLPRKTGLSGGWKRFAEDHKLVDSDALVFQLVKPTEFKVYITRVNRGGECDKAAEVTNLDTNVKRVRAGKK